MTYRKSMSDAIREVQESTIKPYVSISSGGQYNVLDKDGKVAFSTRDSRLANDYLKKNYDKLKENLNEAVIVSDISDVTIPVLKKQAREMNVKVKRVTPGMFSDYEVEFEGSEQNLIKYAKKWLGFGGTSFSGLKKDLAMESVEDELNEISDKVLIKF